CGAINVIDKFFSVKQKDSVDVIEHYNLINTYCPFKNTPRKNECHSYEEMVSSAVIYLLKYFEFNYDYKDDFKNDKIAEYAILWLSYKLKQNPQNRINRLNDFYTKHIEKNAQYNTKITTCGAINVIDKFFSVKQKDSVDVIEHYNLINTYCPFKNTPRKNECHSYEEMVSSAVIYLLKYFEFNYDYKDDFKNDKIAEYAILWLSYKLKQNPQNRINRLNDFYTKHIEKNAQYNTKITTVSDNKTYRNIIDKKKDLMDMDINDIFKFYAPFKSLCDMYTELDKENQECENYFRKANELVENFEKLNGNSDITGNNSYRK
ncbi:Plasmodium variant antigen protein Cir/Yir/Bir, putative, partial [Plasmodium chabaudi chabaudi]